jgi:FAD/FMN-containing dehydrogenase
VTARRTFLVQALVTAGVISPSPAWPLAATRLVVANVTGLYSVEVAQVARPTTTRQLSALIAAWPAKVAVGGGRYSMGGQVAVKGGLHVDMRSMNGLVWVRAHEKLVRVQAGTRWRDLQDTLDPLNLAVKTMQSYANFTVGGSVSVNVHGRYVGHGPVGHSVRALQLVRADGSIVEASATENSDLFHAAIGGYGSVGVITEVELEVAENTRIERVAMHVPLARYVEHFEASVRTDVNSVLHNADLLPPAFDAPFSVTWRKTEKALTDTARLTPRGQRYGFEQNAIWAVTELPEGARLWSAVIHPLLDGKPIVKWLNNEASLDVAELEPRTRRISTYALQEYFVPGRNFLSFATGMAAILRAFDTEVLNVSIRHSPADRVSVMPWAREDVFSFVLYYKQRTHLAARDKVGQWTRTLIDLTLANEGRYYLPYQLHATREQFERAYPEAAALRSIKRATDPTAKFTNELWAKYL